jgi:hypothetical protein
MNTVGYVRENGLDIVADVLAVKLDAGENTPYDLDPMLLLEQADDVKVESSGIYFSIKYEYPLLNEIHRKQCFVESSAKIMRTFVFDHKSSEIRQVGEEFAGIEGIDEFVDYVIFEYCTTDRYERYSISGYNEDTYCLHTPIAGMYDVKSLQDLLNAAESEIHSLNWDYYIDELYPQIRENDLLNIKEKLLSWLIIGFRKSYTSELVFLWENREK